MEDSDTLNNKASENEQASLIPYYEDDSYLVTYVSGSTPYHFETFQEFKSAYEAANHSHLKVYMYVNEKGKRHKRKVNYIKGAVDERGTTYLTFQTVIKTQITSLSFSSTGGEITWENPYCKEGTFDIGIGPVNDCDDDFEKKPSMKNTYARFLRVLTGERLSINANCDVPVIIDSLIIKKLILLLSVAAFYTLKNQEEYKKRSKTWLKSEYLTQIEDYEAKAIADVKPISVDKTTCTALIQGSKGEVYSTSLSSCTCMDFKRREHDQYDYRPCKHIRWLAQKLGIVNLIIRPEDVPAYYLEDDPIIDMVLNNRKLFSFSEMFIAESVEGWKNPLITFNNTITIVEDETGKRYELKLWLNRHNIIIDTESPFYDDYGGYLFLDDNTRYIGKMYLDNGGSGYYKIENAATVEIYKYIFAGNQFKVNLRMNYGAKKNYSIIIPATRGFANAYLRYYQDAIEKNEEAKKLRKHLPKPELFSKRYTLN